MTKLSTESKIDFDRSIGTEDRFNLRKWFEKLVETLNQSNSYIWEELFSPDLSISGFTDTVLGSAEFREYMGTQWAEGVYMVRYPELKASFQDNIFKLSGTFESFTDGVLLCSGDIIIEVIKDDDTFKLQSQELSPRFRVQR